MFTNVTYIMKTNLLLGDLLVRVQNERYYNAVKPVFKDHHIWKTIKWSLEAKFFVHWYICSF